MVIFKKTWKVKHEFHKTVEFRKTPQFTAIRTVLSKLYIFRTIFEIAKILEFKFFKKFYQRPGLEPYRANIIHGMTDFMDYSLEFIQLKNLETSFSSQYKFAFTIDTDKR